MPYASEPALGSVSANAASLRPEHRSGRKRDFCSSVPNRTMPFMPIDWCTPMTTDSVPSIWANSSDTRQYPVWVSPAPPYSSGTYSPSRPRSPSSRISSSPIQRRSSTARSS